MLNRRLFLKQAPIAISVATVPAAATAAPVSPQQRFDDALAELKAAMLELDPTVKDWTINRVTGESRSCRLVIAAFNKVET